MKLVYFTIVSLLLCSCRSGTTLYLVRHAEKTDNSRDPELSEIGKQRAARLATILKDEPIKEVYSTNYKRTLSTVEPVCIQKGLIPKLYAADSLNNLARILLTKDQTILVVGHSNSTISLLDALGVKHTIGAIADDDYSNLFKITLYKGSGKKKLKELRY